MKFCISKAMIVSQFDENKCTVLLTLLKVNLFMNFTFD